VATEIAKQVGLSIEHVVLGSDLREMSDMALASRWARIIFSQKWKQTSRNELSWRCENQGMSSDTWGTGSTMPPRFLRLMSVSRSIRLSTSPRTPPILFYSSEKSPSWWKGFERGVRHLRTPWS
jgi:hypothetical protein